MQGVGGMRGPVRYLVYLIVIAALGLRLGFVLTSPARALYWDEPSYHRVAIGYLRALGGTTEPTPGEAVRLGLYRGEVYTATVALVYALFGEQPRAVFVLQALFDTATCLMLFGLARAVGGGRAGVIALTLAALYEPFIFSAARLQTETMTSLLYVGGLWMLCVPQRRRTSASFCAGVLIAAAMLARPAMQWLFPPLLPAVLVRNSDRAWRARLTVVLVFAGGFLVVVGPRLLFTRALLGTPAWSGTLKAGQDLYSGTVFANVGWKTDGAAYADPPRDELLAVIGDPPTRRPLQDDMRAAAVRIWRLHPMESAAVTLHKLYAAWLHPYNDSQWSFLTGVGGQERWHRLLLVLALIGMPLSLRRWRVAVVLLVTTLYLWLTYVVVKIEVRYAVMAMPMMICFAGVALAVLSTGAQRAWRAGQRTRLVTLAAVTAGLVGLTTVSIPRLLQWLPLTPEGAHGARVAVILALIVWLAHVAAALAGPWWRRSTALVLLMPSVTTAALVVLVGRPLAQDWREWQATLAPDRGIVSQEIVVPAASERAQSAELNFDLLPGPAGTGDIGPPQRAGDQAISRRHGARRRRSVAGLLLSVDRRRPRSDPDTRPGLVSDSDPARAGRAGQPPHRRAGAGGRPGRQRVAGDLRRLRARRDPVPGAVALLAAAQCRHLGVQVHRRRGLPAAAPASARRREPQPLPRRPRLVGAGPRHRSRPAVGTLPHLPGARLTARGHDLVNDLHPPAPARHLAFVEP